MKMRFLALVLAAVACEVLAASDPIESGRMEMTARPGYDGRQAYLEERDLVKKAGETWRMRQRRDAIRMAEDFLAQHPYSARTVAALRNMTFDLARMTRDLDERARLMGQSQENGRLLQRLMRSIGHGTDCTSFEDRCRVIQIGEEQAFLEFKGGVKTDESIRVKSPDGVPFDILTVTDGQDRQRKYYFDVSPFFTVPAPQ